ncbi:ABC transporter ATP-binding protein [Butyrivibrio sp. XB500-5]|uniref:ABC transporter ATP-binding protein n=1 Tax=Butyrivibrio sp. XB500-5 TaxID=2364880 RepID=UPI000EAA6618|nr:ABC transporter ATP-binding protein [Butyrivibrio sp. XB500-5]RKM63192.1 ABC transporter ATP-binding protein [Butyrivibrio sp. XB500-5]
MAEKVKEIKVGPGGGNKRGMPAPKIENPGALLSRIMGYVFKYYPIHMITVLVCILVTVFSSIQGTFFTKSLIDSYIQPMLDSGSNDFTPLLLAIARVAVFYALGALASYVQARVMVYINQGTLKRLREELFVHMESLPIKYFDTHAHGDIMSVYTNDIDTLRQMISQSVPQLINSTITIVSVLVSMFILSVPLTFVTLFMVAVMLFCSAMATKASGKNFVDQQKNLGALNGYIEEMMTGQKVVKVFNHEAENIAKFDELNEALCNSAFKANAYSGSLGPINAQLGNTSYVICAMVGGAIALSNNIAVGFTVGALASFLTFNRNFSMPINQVSMQFNSIIMALAGADRIFKLLDAEPETDDGYVLLVDCEEKNGEIVEADHHTGHWAWKHYHKATDTTTYQKMEGDVTFNGVDFGYTDDKMVLHDIVLHATPGQKIAFVGSTGAGKTTITNLINRFYDIQDGKIRYDNININKIKKADLRRSLGIVLQDTHLFTGTVADNIRFGKLNATDEEVIAAAKLANAHSFIKRLPEGYDTMLTGDGANLSQGQRQLLAIARAAIADPPVLILDEATSSIDTRTEKIVQDGMDKLMKGRTTFVIAHRLSTVRNSDCIIVLEQGRIVEQGTHDELIAKKQRYYQLYTGMKPETA